MTGGGPPSCTVGMPGAGCSFVLCEKHKAMVDVRCQQCLLATLLCTATLPCQGSSPSPVQDPAINSRYGEVLVRLWSGVQHFLGVQSAYGR